METTFDYIIAGAGCAGLSLAYALSNSILKDKKLLIVDLSHQKTNDRTWCYWTKAASNFPEIVYKSWSNLAFIDDQGKVQSAIAPYRYEMIRGIDFYQFVYQRLEQQENVHLLEGRINNIDASAERAWIDVNGQRFFADRIFDSCFNFSQLQSSANNNYHFQLQHFLGWTITTDESVFAEDTATLMDFRTPQKGNARFFYVLPISEKKALVEYTIFSSNLLNKSDYQEALETYIHEQIGQVDYQIEEEEYGIIPMTDVPFPVVSQKRIIPLGIRANAAKPSTGYAFLNIQQQVKEIVEQLIEGSEQITTKSSRSRYQFYDSLLLHILEEEGHVSASIFGQLFHRNKMKTILRFLSEQTHLWEEALIFSQLPKLPFLKALYQIKLNNRNVTNSTKVLSSQNQQA